MVKKSPAEMPENVTQMPQFVGRRQAREARRIEAEGELFNLPKTGGQARVRRPSLLDASIIGVLPQSSQAEVAGFMQDLVNRRGAVADAKKKDKDAVAVNEGVELLMMAQKRTALAADLCVACFITPRLFKTEAELDSWLEVHPDDDFAMLVDDLHPDERAGFLMAAFEEMGGVADSRLTTFRGKPIRDVSPQSNEQAPAETIGADGTEGTGI